MRSTLVPRLCSSVPLCLGAILLTSVAHAQINSWMFIPGIPGDATQQEHVGWIALTSYSQTFATKACSRVVVLKLIDRSSPALITTAAGNVLLPQVRIAVSKPGPADLDFYKATLTNVLIERVDVSGETGILTEQVVLRPQHINISYIPVGLDGKPGQPIVSTMDCP